MLRIVAMVGACALSGACTPDINNKDAVLRGVRDHLATRKNLDLDLSKMNLEVASVSFRASEAEAVISFTPRDGAPSTGMQMRYTLERKGAEWAVKTKAESGANPHSTASPEAAPPGGAQLPPGHPPVGKAK